MAKHKRKEKTSTQSNKVASVHKQKVSHINKPSTSFNFKKTINNPTLKKYLFNEKILILILILIPMLVSTHYRMYSSDLEVTEQWALDSYKNNLRGQVTQQIASQYPNLPQAQRDQFVNEQLDEMIASQEELIQPQIDQTADYFKSRMQHENGDTYLLAIDPYLWLTEAENYVENGYPGDVMTDEGADLSRRNGREPSITRFNVHPWLGAQIYKIVSVFDSDFTVQRSMFLLPVIIIALSIIPAFFLGRKIGGNVGGFIAGLLIALNTSLLGRTPAGFSDTDSYIILFPLLIVWTFMEAITNYKTKNTIIWGSLSVISYVLFINTWNNGWHIAGVVLAVAFTHFILQAIREQKILKQFSYSKIKKTKTFHVSAVVLSFLIGIILVSFVANVATGTIASKSILGPVTDIFSAPLSALTVKSVASNDVWPNVLTTVAELNAGSWNQIIGSLGGKLFFILGIAGVILTIFKKDSKGYFEIRYVALLGIWFIGLSLASVMSARFIALLAAPFAVAFGSFFGILFTKGAKASKKHFQIHALIPQILIILILAFLLSNSFVQAETAARREVPSMTDAWYESLEVIKADSTEGIITSWWDFGHWFVNIAQRRVTFDGGGQGKRIYWVGKSLMTPSVDENKDILRMLNCGQEEGYKRIIEFEEDSYKATNIMTTITHQSREEAAETLLAANIPFENIDYILEKTHCSNEELLDQYYIVSSDMIGKAGVWAHFGGWNFTKAKIYTIAKNNDFETASKEIQALGVSEEMAEKYYFDILGLNSNRAVDSWISPWPNYITANPKGCNQNNETVTCNIRQGLGNQGGQQIILDTVSVNKNDPTNITVAINIVQGGQVLGGENIKPLKVSFDNGEEITTYTVDEKSTFPYEILFVEQNGAYQVIIADPALAKSAFTMLYHFNGKYMDGYEKISDKTSFTGQKIVVYKVDLTT